MWRGCGSKEHWFIALVSLQVVLVLTLLNLYRYCKFEALGNVHFGLRGGELNSEVATYSDIVSYCKDKLGKTDLCEDINRFENAGAILWSLLLIDMIVACVWVLISLVMIAVLKRLIRITSNTNSIPEHLVKVARWLQNAKIMIVAHPLLLIVGLIGWCVISEVDSFSRQTSIEVEEGIILLLILAFISLLTTALYLLHVFNIRRKNLIENSRSSPGINLTFYDKYDNLTPSSKKLDASDTFATPSSSLKL